MSTMPVEPPPSRQSLVVPPRGSNLSVVAGAVASACLGFAAVWAIGLGRTVPRADHDASAPHQPDGHAVADGTDTILPPEPAAGLFLEEPSGAAARPWSPRPDPTRTEPPHEATGVRPASFEAPGRFTPAEGETRPLSRFGGPSAPQLAPVAIEEPFGADGALADPIDAAPGTTPRADDPAIPGDVRDAADPSQADQPAARGPADPFNGAIPLEPASADAASADSAGADPAATTDDTAATTTAAIADGAGEASAGEPSPASSPDMPETGTTPAVDPSAPEESAAVGTDLLPPAAFTNAKTAADTVAPPQPPSPPSARPASTPQAPARPAASAFAAAPPLVADPPSGLPAMPPAAPFASAVPQPAAADGGPPGVSAATAGGADGQGRPGPPQLDGLQSPQFAIEKRGPREIQVGKAARYEILLRNVGSAIARDVVLRDSIPYGTALVTTTPPASPGDAPDALLWRLGELPPGGQARVVVELMPQTEGEIGSVASVTFRADASVRSRATKPALLLECREPEAVRIGRDASLALTVTNPGSGIATGVVLEGTLPENVSHRSGRDLEFDVGQLRPGESRSIDLVLGTTGPGVHPARFIARADGGIETERVVKLEVTAPTLEIAIAMPTRRFLQRPATCAISMVNAGTATARAVELAAQLPPGMKFVRANNAGWHDSRTNRVLWNLEELPPGETGVVEVVVMPVELGPQKLLAAARSADGPSAQVTHVCEVEGVAALAFEVTDSEDPIEIAGITEYVVRVGNQGTKAATGVQLAATLLGDLELVDAKGPAGHRVENLVVFFEPLAKLAPSEDAVYRVRVRGRAAGNQRVQVQLTSEDQPAPITKEETTRVYDDR